MASTFKQQFPNVRTTLPSAPKGAFLPVREAPKNTNPENTTKIFDIAMNGNITDIKNAMSNLNMPLNIKNDDKKSLIHFVLENKIGISENDKLTLIKYLLDHGAGLSVDKYNVTPLHLACKYQYKKIVDYLLNFGDVNICDSNGMNALHYLVQGDVTDCNPNKKVGEFIDYKTKQNHIPSHIVKNEFELALEDDINKRQYKIYDTNPNILKKITNYKCYDINCGIVDSLYNNFVNMNKKDVTGASPLFYALEMNNAELINKLLSYEIVSVINQASKNNLGVVPYKHFINLYKTHALYISFPPLPDPRPVGNSLKQMLFKLTLPAYEDVKTNIQSNDKYKNNIPKYLDIIFPQLIIMYNNMLYFYSKSYINSWSFLDNERLKVMLFGTKLYDGQYKLPILSNLNSGLVLQITKFNNIIINKQQNTDEINKLNTRVDVLNNILNSLEAEYNKYNQLNTSGSYTNIINQIRIKYHKVVDKKTKLNEKIKGYNDLNAHDNIDGKKQRVFDNINTKINNLHIEDKSPVSAKHATIFNNISSMYDDIFTTVGCYKPGICDDYFLYNELWRNLINSDDKLNNISNIHLKIVGHTIGLFNDMDKITEDNHRNINMINNDFQLLNMFCGNILVNTINSIDELPQYYNVKENYVLTEILDIIIHIVKHVLCVNLYYAIHKALIKFVADVRKRNVKPDFYDIIKTTDLGKALTDYILDKMPKLLVKKTLEIYEGDEEKKREKDIDIDVLFQTIIDLINKNIKDIPEFITDLNDNILPYYKDICKNTIPLMKVVIDNYNRFILNDCRFINNAVVINEKVKHL
jgi:ankyrin repeat protein